VVGKPSIEARIPKRVPCNPLPRVIIAIPVNRAQIGKIFDSIAK